MFFGLTNSPATFQTMMNKIFQDLISEGVVCVYLDDILIFTETMEEHDRVTRLVLERLQQYKLYLRHDKCEFAKTKIEYLGLIISHGPSGDGSRENCQSSGMANTEQQERGSVFLGLYQFILPLIQGFSDLARPMFDLTRKDSAWRWGKRRDQPSRPFQTCVISALILVFPDETRPFRVEADSSDFATGAVLSQQSPEDDKWHPVAYYSKKSQCGGTELQDP